VAEGAIYGAINGFSAGAIMYCVSQGISAIANAANKAKSAAAFSTTSTNPQDYLNEALRQQGLKSVPQGGFKQAWVQDGNTYIVRVHAANPQYTTASQIYRVSRQAVGAGRSAIQYLGTNGTWYGMQFLKPTSALFSNYAAMVTHIPIF